jgi:hypothetical protein
VNSFEVDHTEEEKTRGVGGAVLVVGSPTLGY